MKSGKKGRRKVRKNEKKPGWKGEKGNGENNKGVFWRSTTFDKRDRVPS